MSTKVKNIVTVCFLAVFLFGFALWGALKPAGKTSESERRPLAQCPSLSTATVLSGEFMSGFETYSLDQFPLRDEFRTLKAVTAFYVFAQNDNNGIYIEDGYASKLEYPLSESSLEHAAERFKFLYDKFMADSDVKLYMSLVPDKNYFLAEPNGYPSIDYDELIASMREKTDYMQYIDITDLLDLEDYYKTDIHWRQEKIVDVAQRLATAMGTEVSDDLEERTLEKPYYGVFYGQAALPMRAEKINYLTSKLFDECIVFNFETNSEMSMYDMEKGMGKDPYELFLSGSISLISIENPNAATDKELVVFRDSFGSSLAPLLTEGYAKITLVDIRYLASALVGNLIDFTNQDVLFLYSAPVLNNSVTMK